MCTSLPAMWHLFLQANNKCHETFAVLRSVVTWSTRNATKMYLLLQHETGTPVYGHMLCIIYFQTDKWYRSFVLNVKDVHFPSFMDALAVSCHTDKMCMVLFDLMFHLLLWQVPSSLLLINTSQWTNGINCCKKNRFVNNNKHICL